MEVGIDETPLIVEGSELAAYCQKLIDNVAYEESIHLHKLQHTHTLQQLPSHLHLYHCMNNGVSIKESYKRQTVCTIHTMLPYTHPHLCHPNYSKLFFKTMAYHQTHQTPLLTTSNTLREEISHYLGRQETTIKLIQIPIESMYHPTVFELGSLWVRDQWGIDGPYMLAIGDCHNSKQLEAMLGFFKAIQTREPNLKLVMVMPKCIVQQAYKTTLIHQVTQKNLERDVCFLRGLRDYDRLYLYQEAKCFLDFSVDSSLNVYMLEAKACGCPVVCSDTSLHHELMGEEGTYIALETIQEAIGREDLGIGLPTFKKRTARHEVGIEGSKSLSKIYRELFE